MAQGVISSSLIQTVLPLESLFFHEDYESFDSTRNPRRQTRLAEDASGIVARRAD